MLHPMVKRILRWRTCQNMVVTIYLEGYLSVEDSFRQSLPYHLDQDQGVLRDRAGTIITEFVLINSNVNVIWLRSHDVLNTLDELGSLMQEQLTGVIM